jgi:hypothetical protein
MLSGSHIFKLMNQRFLFLRQLALLYQLRIILIPIEAFIMLVGEMPRFQHMTLQGIVIDHPFFFGLTHSED